MLNTSISIESLSVNLQSISLKIINEERISSEEGLVLYKEASLPLLGSLANAIREKKKMEIKHSLTKIYILNQLTYVFSIVNSAHIPEN